MRLAVRVRLWIVCFSQDIDRFNNVCWWENIERSVAVFYLPLFPRSRICVLKSIHISCSPDLCELAAMGLHRLSSPADPVGQRAHLIIAQGKHTLFQAQRL